MGIRSRVEAKLISIEPYTSINPAVLDKMIGTPLWGDPNSVIVNAWMEDGWLMGEIVYDGYPTLMPDLSLPPHFSIVEED